jgi:hypothetical protein
MSTARRYRKRIGVLAGAAVLTFMAYALLAATVLNGPVTAGPLATSVNRTIDVGSQIYDDAYGCRPDGRARTWVCNVPDSDSGVVSYRVTVRTGTSCWDARLLNKHPEQTAGMPDTATGCVRRWQWLPI